jgi:hypothetical protein
MTAVPGQHIGSYASRSDVPTSTIIDAARTLAMALEQCWSSGRRHGDLNFGNVLFDIDAKNISFIDAGTRDDCRICNGVINQSAATSDLAHLLWEVTHVVMDLIRSQTGRMSSEMFAENVLRTIVDRIDSQEEKRRLLTEIWWSAQQHFTDKLDLPWSVQSVWNSFVKQVATRRTRSIIERVSSHAGFSFRQADQYEARARPAVQSTTS